MGLGLKKALHKTRKLGNKVAKKSALGLKRAGKISKQVGKVAVVVGDATGNKELTGIGRGLEEGGQRAKRAGKGIEKIRKGDIEGGVKNFL